MKNLWNRSFASLLALVLLALASPAFAKDRSESELIADLSAPNPGTVTDALQQLEKKYPTSPTALPAIKKLLTDPRPPVRIKAARVLGALHSQVDATDVSAICAMLKATDKQEVEGALKSLRGLVAPSAVPQLTPLLNNPDNNIKRDACRTLAVLGDKSVVPSIEPLLKYPDPKVQKDAMDAIALLKAKP